MISQVLLAFLLAAVSADGVGAAAVTRWEPSCRQAIYCNLINGDVSRLRKAYDPSFYKRGEELAAFFDVARSQSLQIKFQKFLTNATLWNNTSIYKSFQDEFKQIGLELPDQAQSTDNQTAPIPALVPIQLTICLQEVGSCLKLEPEVQLEQNTDCQWKSFPATIMECEVTLKHWPQVAIEHLSPNHKECTLIKEICKPRSLGDEPSCNCNKPTANGKLGPAECNPDKGITCELSDDAARCNASRSNYTVPLGYEGYFGQVPCGRVISDMGTGSLDNQAKMRQRINGGGRATPDEFRSLDWTPCPPGRYVTSLTLERNKKGFSNIKMACDAPGNWTGKEHCDGAIWGLKVNGDEPRGPYYLTNIIGLCSGKEDGHVPPGGNTTFDDTIACGDFEAICAYRAHIRETEGNEDERERRAGLAEKIAIPIAATVAAGILASSIGIGAPAAAAASTAVIVAAIYLAIQTYQKELDDEGLYVHDIQVYCCKIKYDCTMYDRYVIDMDATVDLSDQESDKPVTLTIATGTMTSQSFQRGGSSQTSSSQSDSVKLGLPKLLDEALNVEFQSETTKGRVTETNWKLERADSTTFQRTETQTLNYTGGLETRGYRAIAGCGVGQHFARVGAALEPIRVPFIRADLCQVVTRWEFIDIFNHSSTVVEALRINIGTNFTLPDEKYLKSPPKLTQGEVTEGLLERVIHKSTVVLSYQQRRLNLTQGVKNTEFPVSFTNTATATSDIPLRSILLQRVNECRPPHNSGQKYTIFTDEIIGIEVPEVNCTKAKAEFRIVEVKGYKPWLPINGIPGQVLQVELEVGIKWPHLTPNYAEFLSDADLGYLKDELKAKFVELGKVTHINYLFSQFGHWRSSSSKTRQNRDVILGQYETAVLQQLVGTCEDFTVYTDQLISVLTSNITTPQPGIEHIDNSGNLHFGKVEETGLPVADNCTPTDYYKRLKIGSGGHDKFVYDDRNGGEVRFGYDVGITWQGRKLDADDEFEFEQKGVSSTLLTHFRGLGFSSQSRFNWSELAMDVYGPLGVEPEIPVRFNITEGAGIEAYQLTGTCGSYTVFFEQLYYRNFKGRPCVGGTGAFTDCTFIPVRLPRNRA